MWMNTVSVKLMEMQSSLEGRFLRQGIFHLLVEHAVVGIVLLEVGLQDANVLGEGDVPIHEWEVLSLCHLLVKIPEDLHDAEGQRGHQVCEVATRWRNRSNDCSRLLSLKAGSGG